MEHLLPLILADGFGQGVAPAEDPAPLYVVPLLAARTPLSSWREWAGCRLAARCACYAQFTFSVTTTLATGVLRWLSPTPPSSTPGWLSCCSWSAVVAMVRRRCLLATPAPASSQQAARAQQWVALARALLVSTPDGDGSRQGGRARAAAGAAVVTPCDVVAHGAGVTPSALGQQPAWSEGSAR